MNPTPPGDYYYVMDQVITQLLEQWGFAGAILLGLGYLIYIRIKDVRGQSKNTKHIDDSIDTLSQKVDDKFKVTNERIDVLNERVEDNHKQFENRFEQIESSISAQPGIVMGQIRDKEIKDNAEHQEKFLAQFSSASKLNKILNTYIKSVNCDHIFVGYFHNGGTSLSGIPFCKYDIIAEKFKPGIRDNDVEFCPIYKDVNIYSHGDLPIFLTQNKYVYFKINDDLSSDLQDVDDILYRRMVGRKVKQILVHLLYDENGSPFGFVGGIEYEGDELDIDEIKECAKELENIHEN